MEYVIRQMKRSDIASVAELERKSFSMPWSKEAIADVFEKEDKCYLVAEKAGRIVGYIGLWQSFETADLCHIAVDESSRRQGIGEALLSEGEHSCRMRGAEQIFLEVRASNEAAVSLYQSAGYEKISQRKNYYHCPTEDAWIYRKIL